MQYKSATFVIHGAAPIVMHNGRLADPQSEIVKAMKRLTSKRDKTDSDHAELARLEWYGGLYLDDGKPCIPSELVEAMLIEAAKKRKKGPAAKAGIICEKNFPLEYEGPKDPDEMWESEDYRLTVGVKVQRNRIMRTRPIFRKWQASIEVHYMDELLNERDIKEFLEIGGTIIGLGDWRPKFGRFEVI